MLLNGPDNPRNLPLPGLPLGDLHPIQYMRPWIHPNLHPKRHLNRFSRFRTAHRRLSHYFTTGRYVFQKNLPSPLVIGSPTNTWYLWPTQVIAPSDISIGSAVFNGPKMLCCTTLCQWGRKPPKLPIPVEISSPCRRRTEPLRYAISNLKIGKDRACGSGDMLADRQTDRHTDVLITILRHRTGG